MKNKVTKDSLPKDFTLSLAIVDSIPVLFFGLSMILISIIFSNKLFLLGSLLCLVAGICKVLWKFIVVLKKKNIWFLFIQMRILTPIGFVLMIVSWFITRSTIDYHIFLSMPSIIFFTIGILGMLLMLVFGFTLDNNNIKNNWLEQITNGIAQFCFFIGLLLLVI